MRFPLVVLVFFLLFLAGCITTSAPDGPPPRVTIESLPYHAEVLSNGTGPGGFYVDFELHENTTYILEFLYDAVGPYEVAFWGYDTILINADGRFKTDGFGSTGANSSCADVTIRSECKPILWEDGVRSTRGTFLQAGRYIAYHATYGSNGTFGIRIHSDTVPTIHSHGFVETQLIVFDEVGVENGSVRHEAQFASERPFMVHFRTAGNNLYVDRLTLQGGGFDLSFVGYEGDEPFIAGWYEESTLCYQAPELGLPAGTYNLTAWTPHVPDEEPAIMLAGVVENPPWLLPDGMFASTIGPYWTRPNDYLTDRSPACDELRNQ